MSARQASVRSRRDSMNNQSRIPRDDRRIGVNSGAVRVGLRQMPGDNGSPARTCQRGLCVAPGVSDAQGWSASGSVPPDVASHGTPVSSGPVMPPS